MTPSVVTFTPTWDYVVGAQAVHAADQWPERSIHNIKRLLTRGEDAGVGHKRFDPVTLASLVIRFMLDCAERQLGVRVGEVMASLPADFSWAQATALVQAIELAGASVTRLIPEPNAAGLLAVDWLRERGPLFQQGTEMGQYPSANVLVIDMGGGTTDISIVDVADMDGAWTVEVVVAIGDNELGGTEYDVTIHKEFTTKFIDPARRRGLAWGPRDDRRLLYLARQAKEALGCADRFEATLSDLEVEPGHLGALTIHANRDDLADAVRVVDSRLIELIETAFSLYAKKPTRGGQSPMLAGVILAGQGSRMWTINKYLRDRFRDLEFSTRHQENAVSFGLSGYGEVLAGRRKDVLLLDVITRSLGIRYKSVETTEDGLFEYSVSTVDQENTKVALLMCAGDILPSICGLALKCIDNGHLSIPIFEIGRDGTAGATVVLLDLNVRKPTMLHLHAGTDADGARGFRVSRADSGQVLAEKVISLCNRDRLRDMFQAASSLTFRFNDPNLHAHIASGLIKHPRERLE